MKFHAIYWRPCGRGELVMLIGLAFGRVHYHPKADWLYSFRLYLLFWRIEICWTTGASK